MGITKSDCFTEQQNDLSVLTKALGHPARIAILEFLAKQTSCICGEIVAELPLSQASISRHLVELKAAGLIKGTISGTSVCYCINETHFPLINTFIQQLQTPTNQSCCS